MIQSVTSLPYTAPPSLEPIYGQKAKPRHDDRFGLASPSTASVAPGASGSWLLNPLQSFNLHRRLTENPVATEPYENRVAWYKDLEQRLSNSGRHYLKQQLLSGRLTDCKSLDGRSTLSHLHGLLQPRANGFDRQEVLEETVRLLCEPKAITQKFGVMSESSIQKIEGLLKNKVKGPIDRNQIRYTFSSTCPAASLMYDMIDKQPSEFVRQLADLTSPRLCFWQRVSRQEVSPDDPSKAPERLKEFGIEAYAMPGTNNQYYQVKIPLSDTAQVRALNQQGRKDKNIRGVVESAYQDALVKLVEPTYDPGAGMLVKPDGTLAPFEGLIDAQTSMLESIIKNDGGETSVDMQFILSGSDNEPYLVGYYQPFEQTQQVLLQALDPKGKYNTNVLVGIVSTDPSGTSGRLNMKHEITLTKAYTKNGELWFQVADSDDNKPELVDWPAKKLIPMIHHAVLPAELAKQILAKINAQPENQYLVPDQTDASNFNLISTVPGTQQQSFIADFERRSKEEEAKQAPPKPVSSQPQLPPQEVSRQIAPVVLPPQSMDWRYTAYNAQAYRPFVPMSPVAQNPWQAYYQAYYRQPQAYAYSAPYYNNAYSQARAAYPQYTTAA